LKAEIISLTNLDSKISVRSSYSIYCSSMPFYSVFFIFLNNPPIAANVILALSCLPKSETLLLPRFFGLSKYTNSNLVVPT